MEDKKDIIIIIPMYNEEQLIIKTITSWEKVLNELKINYIIEIHNDGSTDNSTNIINEYIQNNTHIKLINNPHKGFSKTLYNAYKNIKNTDYVFHADADNEIPPDNFNLIWENRNNSDLLIGIRNNRNQTISRILASYFAKKIMAMLFNNNKIIINDVNCPFRLIRKEILDKIIKNLPENYLYPNLYVCAYCLKNNLRIKEFPFEYKKPKRKSHLDNIFKLTSHEIISLIQLLKYKMDK